MIAPERRIAVTRSHIDAALEICKRTQVKLVYELEHLIRASAVIAEPNFKQARLRAVCWYDDAYGLRDWFPPLRFYAFYPEDIGNARKEIWDRVSEAHATYREASHSVTLHQPEQVESPFIQGCAVLHEVSHALFAIQEGRVYDKKYAQTSDGLLAEELKNYEMEMCLWRERSPSIFQSLLDEVVSFVDRQHHFEHSTSFFEPGELLTRHPELSTLSHDLLGQLLGKLPENVSSKHRVAYLSLFAHFEYIDRSDFSDKFNRKIEVLRLLHQDILSYQ